MNMNTFNMAFQIYYYNKDTVMNMNTFNMTFQIYYHNKDTIVDLSKTPWTLSI